MIIVKQRSNQAEAADKLHEYLEKTVTFVSTGKSGSQVCKVRSHLLDRGWVDFGSDVPSILHSSSALSAKLPPAQAEWGRQIKFKTQPRSER